MEHGNDHGTWEIVPFVNRAFALGTVIAAFCPFGVFCLAIVPGANHFNPWANHWNPWANPLNPRPKLRKSNAVLITTANSPSPATLAAPAARRKSSLCGTAMVGHDDGTEAVTFKMSLCLEQRAGLGDSTWADSAVNKRTVMLMTVHATVHVGGTLAEME